MSEVFDDEWHLHFWELPAFRSAVWRIARVFPRLRDDLFQEAALAVVRKQDRIAAADDPRSFLKVIVRCACLELLRREFPGRPERYAVPVLRDRFGRRRGYAHTAARVKSREPAPDFLAVLREEFGDDPAPPPESPRRRRPSVPLTADELATLRAIVLRAAGWTRDQVVGEFLRRSGRPIHPETVKVHCRALGLAVPWAGWTRELGRNWSVHCRNVRSRVF